MVALKPLSKQTIDLVIQRAPPSWPNAKDAKQRAFDPSGLWSFLITVYFTDFMQPFDWQTEFSGGLPSTTDLTLIDHLSLEQLHKLLIAHIRKDHFCTDYLKELVESGYLSKLLARLATLRQAMP